MSTKLKIIWIRWRDSHIYVNDYHYIDEKEERHVVTFESVGYLVESNDDRVTIAVDYEADQRRYRQLMSIPRENIVKQRIVRL